MTRSFVHRFVHNLLKDLSKGTLGPRDEHPPTGQPSDLLTSLLPGRSDRKFSPVFRPSDFRNRKSRNSGVVRNREETHTWVARSAS